MGRPWPNPRFAQGLHPMVGMAAPDVKSKTGRLTRTKKLQREVVLLCLVWTILGSLCGCAKAEVVNSKIKRLIDISTQMVRTKTTYQVDGVGSSYSFGLPASSSDRVAYISATVKGDIVVPERREREDSKDLTMYALDAKGGGDSVEIVITAIYTDYLEAFPKEITQVDNQLVLYTGSMLVGSPYATTTQSTSVRLGSKEIIDMTNISGKTSVKGETVNYGPFTGTEPFSQGDTMHLHYVNHSPFAKVSTCLREIEVSHWGNIAVEEHYSMEHAGARLKGGFSRMDYMALHHEHVPNPSFRRLEAKLPPRARDIYYRDNIGNISTSTVRETFEGVEVSLLSRFPMYGGWKNAWYQGYNLPTEEGLQHEGSQFELTMHFGAPFPAVWVEDLTVKVILPEGAKNVLVRAPFDVVAETRTKRFTFLDTSTVGRPVVILQMKNVVKEHNVPFVVTYDFSQMRMLMEPLLLTGFFFIFFLLAMFLSRLNTHRRNRGRDQGRVSSQGDNTKVVGSSPVGALAPKEANSQ